MQLRADICADLFPFHLMVAPDLTVRNLGPSLKKLCPTPDQAPGFMQLFEITKPRGIEGFEELTEACGSKIVLRHRNEPFFRLECSGAPLANGTVFLVGSLIAKSLAEVDALGLTFDDFAPHDRMLPFLAAVQSQLVALRDARRLAEIQAELRHSRDHLQELVNDRTRELQEKSLRLADALIQEKEASKLQREFISIVSHELRTPLTIIDGAIQRLQRSKDATGLAGKFEDWAPQIRQAVADMTSLIGRALTSRKLEDRGIKTKLVNCDPATVIEKVANQISETCDHEVRLDLKRLPSRLESDVEALEHIFMNLLSNAVKYSPGAPHVDVRAWLEDDWLCVAIEDHGVGIPERDMPKLFRRFFRAQTAKDFEGTGLGLNIAREYVELLSGRIDVDSTLGHGTTFTVRLPLRQAGASTYQNTVGVRQIGNAHG